MSKDPKHDIADQGFTNGAPKPGSISPSRVCETPDPNWTQKAWDIRQRQSEPAQRS